LYDQQTWQQEASGALETVFLDGKLVKEQTIAEIRARVGFMPEGL
jgi:nicotinamide phosphoribosyltransferase